LETIKNFEVLIIFRYREAYLGVEEKLWDWKKKIVH
jgi:hypothetical protein